LSVQTPTLQPQTDPDRIVLVPEVEEPQRRTLIILAVLALVAAMALGGGIVYAWAQGELRDSDQAVHAAQVDAAEARSDADTSLALVNGLQAEVTRLEGELSSQQANQTILEGKNADAQAQLDRTTAKLNEVKAELRSVTGPKVNNGRHIAYLLEAGTAQSPPMIVIDLGRWYTGDAARQAAIADGALTTGEHLYQGRYLRNTEHDWRILPVGTGALFTILPYNGNVAPTNVSLTTLATILNGTSSSSERIAHDPFWVQVQHHQVVSGHEQRYRAP
jgi:hypothetical protein